MASNLRSCPTLRTASSSRTGFRTFRAVSDRFPGAGVPWVQGPSPGRWSAIGTYRECRGPVENDSPTMPARIAAGESGSTRRPKRPNASTRRRGPGARRATAPSRSLCRRSRRSAYSSTSDWAAQAREQLEATIAGRASITNRLGIEGYGNVGADPRQLAALPGILGVVQQAFPVALVADCGMLQQRIDRPVGRNQSRAPFSPTPGTPLMLSIESPISAIRPRPAPA